ncbi:MAG TPA: hypothetical protein VG734_17640 [Lacunisphaera sp.]|nr:hypothetical protein [Lacunisphaera sp.]
MLNLKKSVVGIVRGGWLVVALGLAPAICAEPLNVPPGVAQLFVGDRLIEKNLSVVRTLHQPRKDDDGSKPILFLENEFNGVPGTLQGGTIVFDRKLGSFVMFANAGAHLAGHPWDWIRLYRFTSVDGLNWTKGDRGAPECVFPKSREDFLDRASGAYATNLDLTTIIYDERDAQHPYRGWMWFANWGDEREGMYFIQSADGHAWERGAKVAPMEAFAFETATHAYQGPYDATGFTPDPEKHRYIASLKIAARNKAGGERYRARAYCEIGALDQPIAFDRSKLVRLEPTRSQKNGDLPDDEYYFSDSWRYGSMWLGTLKIHHENTDYPYSKAGCCFLKLIYSYDGLHWSKVPYPNEGGIPEVFLPNGPEGGNDGRNDGGYITTFQNGPLRIGDELIYYYASSSFGKNHPAPRMLRGGGIFRSRLRVDGFVSVDAGTLVTVPLTTSGQDLFLNHVGDVSVVLLDKDNTELSQATVTGDSLLGRVAFRAGRLGDLTRKEAFKLKISVPPGSRLYAFQFR